MLMGATSPLLRAQHGLLPHRAPCFSTVRPRQPKYRPTQTVHRINSSQGGQSGLACTPYPCLPQICERLDTRQIGCTGSASITARENESKEVALERMIQESARVEEQVIQIFNHQEFQQQLEEVICTQS